MKPFLMVAAAIGAGVLLTGCGGGGSTPVLPPGSFPVGPAGGTFTFGRATLVVPSGAVAGNGTVTFSADGLPPTDPRVIGATRVNVSLTGTTLVNPFTLRLAYLDGEIGPKVETALRTGRWNGTRWDVVSASSANAATNTVSTPISTLGTFTVFGRRTFTDTPRVIFRDSSNRLAIGNPDGTGATVLYTPDASDVSSTATASVPAATFSQNGDVIFFIRQINNAGGNFSELWRVNDSGAGLTRIRVNTETAKSLDVGVGNALLVFTTQISVGFPTQLITSYVVNSGTAFGHGGADATDAFVNRNDKIVRIQTSNVGPTTTVSLADGNASNAETLSAGDRATRFLELIPDQNISQSERWALSGNSATGTNPELRSLVSATTLPFGITGRIRTGAVRWDDTVAYFVSDAGVFYTYNFDTATLNADSTTFGANNVFDVR